MRNLFLIVAVIHTALTSDIDVTDCYTKLLQSSKFHESDVTCKNTFDNHTTEFRNDIMSRAGPYVNSTCIDGIFNKYKVYRMYLQGIAQQHVMKNFTAEKFEDEIEESIDTVMSAAIVLCSVDELQAKSYKDLFEISGDEDDISMQNTTHNELCVQKYMIDKNIIDKEKFTFSSHVENVTDCENTFTDLEDLFKESVADNRKMSDTFFGLSTDRANSCTANMFKKEKTFPKLYSLKVVMKLNLTEDQKKELKENYIQWTVSTLVFMFECMKFI